MKFAVLTALLMMLATFKSSAQDCVAQRSIKAFCAVNSGGHADIATDKWLINITNR